MKTQPFFFIISFSLIFLLFIACNREESTDVNQDKIHASYELFYNPNVDKTYAKATFKFSNNFGTHLQLTSPSKVTFNGDELTFKNVLAYYQKEYVGLVSSGTFVWTDANGTSYTNAISIKSINYPLVLDTIQRNAAYEMFWLGDSLISFEKVVLIADGLLDEELQVFTQDNINTKSIILAKNKLEQISQGQGTLLLDRYFETLLTQKTSAGGRILGRYGPISRTVYFD